MQINYDDILTKVKEIIDDSSMKYMYFQSYEEVSLVDLDNKDLAFSMLNDKHLDEIHIFNDKKEYRFVKNGSIFDFIEVEEQSQEKMELMCLQDGRILIIQNQYEFNPIYINEKEKEVNPSRIIFFKNYRMAGVK